MHLTIGECDRHACDFYFNSLKTKQFIWIFIMVLAQWSSAPAIAAQKKPATTHAAKNSIKNSLFHYKWQTIECWQAHKNTQLTTFSKCSLENCILKCDLNCRKRTHIYMPNRNWSDYSEMHSSHKETLCYYHKVVAFLATISSCLLSQFGSNSLFVRWTICVCMVIITSTWWEIALALDA